MKMKRREERKKVKILNCHLTCRLERRNSGNYDKNDNSNMLCSVAFAGSCSTKCPCYSPPVSPVSVKSIHYSHISLIETPSAIPALSSAASHFVIATCSPLPPAVPCHLVSWQSSQHWPRHLVAALLAFRASERIGLQYLLIYTFCFLGWVCENL